MKKILTFIPLGVGISAAIIYILNLISFRVIGNSMALMEYLSNLKIYLYISIIGFLAYFFIKVLYYIKENQHYKNNEVYEVPAEDKRAAITTSEVKTYEPLEFKIDDQKKEQTLFDDHLITKKEENKDNYIGNRFHKYCYNCGEELFNSDKYCNNCGANQYTRRKNNSFVRKIINIIEIIILLLIIYFSINMLFDYKEKTDPNFKSPFKVSMTK